MRLLRAAVALILLFVLAPAVVVVGSAFSQQDLLVFPPKGFTLHWFGALFSSSDFGAALLLSIELALVATVLAIIISLPAAYAIARRESRVTQACYYFLLSPVLVPQLLLGFALLYVWVVFQFPLGLPALIPAHVLLTLPFVVTILMQSMRRTDLQAELAARVSGASSWETFWHVTLPSIRLGIVTAASVAFLLSFDQLPSSLFLKTIGPGTLPVYLYDLVEYDISPVLSALSVVIMVVNIALLTLVIVLMGRLRAVPRPAA